MILTIKGLRRELEGRLGLSRRSAGQCVDTVLDTLQQALEEGHGAKLRGIGSLEWRYTPPRLYRDPRGTLSNVSGGYKLKFRPAVMLRKRRGTKCQNKKTE